MPADSIFVAVAVIAIFVVFAAALIWADFQTRQNNWLDNPVPSAAHSDPAGKRNDSIF